MGIRRMAASLVLVLGLGLAAAAWAQGGYQPRFSGDPAHSEAEAAALGYMRTVAAAQREYKKKRGAYATALADLVHVGSFTRRMVNTDRGDYAAHFRSTGKAFSLALTPKQFDPQHRAFYVDDTGKIRAEEDRPATADSPPLK